ncbi:hypothetical protein [Terrarubrum flagellatum]|uniref:hypothetical protein n=1 Tax=Terrirubrum flagellatum TaxID=2895980 RepID=UPI0031451CBF
MTGLRRKSTFISLLIAWLMMFSALMGGLTSARALPRAYLDMLSATSLCAPGESSPQGGDHRSHGPDCGLCARASCLHASSAILPGGAPDASPIRRSAEVAFGAAFIAGEKPAVIGGAQARGPPRA